MQLQRRNPVWASESATSRARVCGTCGAAGNVLDRPEVDIKQSDWLSTDKDSNANGGGPATDTDTGACRGPRSRWPPAEQQLHAWHRAARTHMAGRAGLPDLHRGLAITPPPPPCMPLRRARIGWHLAPAQRAARRRQLPRDLAQQPLAHGEGRGTRHHQRHPRHRRCARQELVRARSRTLVCCGRQGCCGT